MLSDIAIDNLIQPVIDRQEEINMYVIQKIINRLKAIKQLTKTDIKTLKSLAVTGVDIRELNAELARQSNLQVRDIKQIIKTTAADVYKEAEPFYDYRHKSYIPLEKNEKMQRIINGIANQTRDTYRNLSNSSATGFLLRDEKNPLKTNFYKIDDAYRKVIDEAIQSVLTDVVPIDRAINHAVKQLLNSGVRRIYWDSGYSQRLDTAVRRNVLDGVREIRQKMHDELGKEFGADGKELSAHPYSAPDHEPFQGHIFTNEEWDNLQGGFDFKDIKGQHFDGVERNIGVWNCRHTAKSIIIDKYRPRYKPERLQKFIDENKEGYTLPNGKHLTLYECAQMQRRMETRIRYTKEEQMAMKELGNKNAERLARQKVIKLTKDYKEFSDNCGLKVRVKRCSIPNYRIC